MTSVPDPSIEIRIGDDATPLWMRRSALVRGNGPIMPEPNHDEKWPFDVCYAYLCTDGMIRRYKSVIGVREDIVEVGP